MNNKMKNLGACLDAQVIKIAVIISIATVFFSPPVWVQAGQSPNSASLPSTDQVLQDLLDVLEEETEIATKTKLNIDFVPGMVSVLHGKDLLLRGYRTVYEALALIPGVELSMSNDGHYQVIVRQVGKTYSSGKVKFLLNGVSFNSTLNAVTTALVIPTDIVDRIEVIRGPGSAIYGEFASVGVINIVTNKKAGDAFVRYSDIERYTVGAQSAFEFDSGISIATNFSYEKNEGGSVQAGSDVLASSQIQSFRDISNSPGPVNDQEENTVFTLNLDYKQFQLNWQFVEREISDYFGASNALSNGDARRETYEHNVELSNGWKHNELLQTNLRAGWLRFAIKSDQLTLYPQGIFPSTGFENEGVLGAPNYEEDKYYLGVDVSFKGLQQHDILFGIDWSQTEQGETYAQRNYYVDENTGQLVYTQNGTYTGDKNWLEENLTRRVFAVYAQDQYAVDKDLLLTAGIRWDHYNDIGSDFTPRLAAVYHLSDRQTLKMQYAESFRPPTFLEQYAKNNAVVSGNPDLKAEQQDNFEIGYVYNDALTIGRVTYFYYDLKDLIQINTANRRYENQGELHARGIELEFIKQLWHRLKVDANVSYAHADAINGEQIPGVAKYLGNIGVVYQFGHDFIFNTQYRYVGKRYRQDGDSRGELPGYNLFDISLTKSNTFISGLALQVAVKNLFDEKVVYPSFLVKAPDGNVRPGYEGDYPQTGREFVVRMALRF